MSLSAAAAPAASDDLYPSFLTIIVDCKGLATLQHLSDDGTVSRKTIEDVVRTIVLFVHSYILLHRENLICVIAANTVVPGSAEGLGGAEPADYEVLFPPPSAMGSFLPASVHVLTEAVNSGLMRCMGNVLSVSKPTDAMASADSAFSTAEGQRRRLQQPQEAASVARPMSMILCAINKQLTTLGSRHLQPRVLVLQRLGDDAAAYHAIMNCLFSAQKMGVAVDGLVLGSEDSSMLQQAAYITAGVYHRHTALPSSADYASALLLVLIYKFLPSTSTRGLLNAPLQETISFRASCSCHKAPVEVAYVCSVCLALTCSLEHADADSVAAFMCGSCKTPMMGAHSERSRQRQGQEGRGRRSGASNDAQAISNTSSSSSCDSSVGAAAPGSSTHPVVL